VDHINDTAFDMTTCPESKNGAKRQQQTVVPGYCTHFGALQSMGHNYFSFSGMRSL